MGQTIYRTFGNLKKRAIEHQCCHFFQALIISPPFSTFHLLFFQTSDLEINIWVFSIIPPPPQASGQITYSPPPPPAHSWLIIP